MNKRVFSNAGAFARNIVSVLALAAASIGCSGATAKPARVPIADIRDDARASSDGNVVANWLLAELIQPGGTAKGSSEARARLDEVRAQGLLPSLARAIDDSMHGRLKSVSDEYLEVVRAAGADPTALNKEGKSARDLAADMGLAALQALLQAL